MSLSLFASRVDEMKVVLSENLQQGDMTLGECCGLLQCVAVWCSLVQSGAVCCSLLQSVAVCCVLQCVAVACSLLQSVAVRCSVSLTVAVCQSVAVLTQNDTLGAMQRRLDEFVNNIFLSLSRMTNLSNTHSRRCQCHVSLA